MRVFFDMCNVEDIAKALDKIEEDGGDTLRDNDVWKAIDLFFEENGASRHAIESFNSLIYTLIPSIVDKFKNTVIEENGKRYEMELGDVIVTRPTFCESDGDTHAIYPMECFDRNITYAGSIHIDTTITPPDGEPTVHQNVHWGNLPILVRSDACNLNGILNDPEKLAKHREDIYDQGGYFTVKGARKVIIAQERSAYNTVYVFPNRKSSPKFEYFAEVRSAAADNANSTKTTVGLLNGKIGCLIPWIEMSAIPLGILFRALGTSSNEEMAALILGEDYRNQHQPLKLLIPSLEYSFECSSQEVALHYIGKRGKRFTGGEDGDGIEDDGEDMYEPLTMMEDEIEMTETEKITSIAASAAQIKNDAISYAKKLLMTEFLPHLGVGEDSFLKKRYFLGYMVKKLIDVKLGYSAPEDRDHYGLKRVVGVGPLLVQQFYSAMRRQISEIVTQTKKALRSGQAVNILSWIKPSTITNSLIGAIANNNWSIKGAAAQGISQTFEQFNYAGGLANGRKLGVPMSKDGGKIIQPRMLHSSHFAVVCVTGDTEVLLADGQVWPIRDLMGKVIVGVNPVTLENESTTFHNFIVTRSPKKVLKISDDAGRNIKCTPEHPFLVLDGNSYVWKQAGTLELGDKLIVQPGAMLEKKGMVNWTIPSAWITDERYLKDLKMRGLVDTLLSDKQRGILASLAGALFTDGSLHKAASGDMRANFNLGEQKDALDIQSDIVSLGFEAGSIQYHVTRKHDDDPEFYTEHHTWRLSKDGSFSCLMAALGVPVGKKKTQILKTPSWILSGSPYVQQKWLSAFQGGDGSKLTFHKNQSRWKLALGKTQLTNTQTKSKGLFEDMATMYKSRGIQTEVKWQWDQAAEEWIIVLSFSQSRENLSKYARFITYTYAHQKERVSAIVREYLSHWEYHIKILDSMYAEIKSGTGITHKNTMISKYGLKYQAVHKIMTKTQTPRYTDIPIETFVDRALPEGKAYSRVRIIEDAEIEPVYDITTHSSYHSFIGNQFVLHNCPSETPEGKRCVRYDTVVYTPTGGKPISDLQNDDEVFSYNYEKQRLEVTSIFNYFSRKEMVYKLVTVYNNTVYATRDHMFWTPRGWKRLDGLTMLDEVYVRGGITQGYVWARIKEIAEDKIDTVCDFTTMNDNHNFFANGFLTHNCGLVKNMALMCYITIGSDPAAIIELILNMDVVLFTDPQFSKSFSKLTKIFVNGNWIGSTFHPEELVNTLRNMKREGDLNCETSIYHHAKGRQIIISTEVGRLCRPLIIVDMGTPRLTSEHIQKINRKEMNWTTLLTSGVIELIDKTEEEGCLIAGFPSDLEEMKHTDISKALAVTHCEMHPATMFGIGGSIIPFPDRNQSPRNCYQCLASNTNVLMADGSWKSIGKVEVGEEVVSFDPSRPEDVSKLQVTKVIARFVGPTTKKMYRLTTNCYEEIVATFDHKFMTKDGWKTVDELRGKKTQLHFLKFLAQRWGCEPWHTYETLDDTNNEAIIEVPTQEIADITTESSNHSFIADHFYVHNSAMGKQAVGIPFTNYSKMHSGSFHVMEYVQRPLALSRSASVIKFDKMPAGINAMTCVMPFRYNQEDSVEINDSSVDRGFMVSTKYICYYCEIRPHKGEEWCIPTAEMCHNFKGDTSKLEEDAFVAKGTRVQEGDVLIGKRVAVSDPSSTIHKKPYTNVSIVYQHKLPGVIHDVQVGLTGEEYPYVRVVVLQRRRPKVGDKFAARHGQKGTCAMYWRQEDLPFNSRGVSPDIMINSLALPSQRL